MPDTHVSPPKEEKEKKHGVDGVIDRRRSCRVPRVVLRPIRPPEEAHEGRTEGEEREVKAGVREAKQTELWLVAFANLGLEDGKPRPLAPLAPWGYSRPLQEMHPWNRGRHIPQPTFGTIDGGPNIQTPSRAGYRPGGRFIFSFAYLLFKHRS